MKHFYFLILFPLSLVACGRQPSQAPPSEPEPPVISVTRWTERTELFLEYPALVSGAARRFAVHLTDLRTFKPIAGGKVSVELERPGEQPQVFEADAPSRPGIFGVDVQAHGAGVFRLAVTLTGPGAVDRHDLGEVEVSKGKYNVSIPEDAPQEETIAFLKEQQWSLDFATEKATERELRESLTVAGEVRPPSGGEVEVTAPISGRITGDPPLPIAGAFVSRGEPLASIAPLPPAPEDRASLELALSEANIALDLTRHDRQRTERLLAAGAIPLRRVEEARAAERGAEVRLRSAEERLREYEAARQGEGSNWQRTFTLRAPIAGIVSELKAAAGSNVGAGESLMRLVAVDPVYLVASVPEAQVPRIRKLAGAELMVPADVASLKVGRLVSKSQFIDPQTRTLSVIYEVPNRTGALAVGQSVTLRLFLPGQQKAISVPESAVVDDAGRPVVFVQLDGEAFARRPVTLGVRESGYVQILEGVAPEERVVTRGAYLIRLAALSTQMPAHGHVH